MSPARKVREKAARSRAARRRAAGPAVAAAHLPSDAELRRIAERVLQFSRRRRNRSATSTPSADALTRFANNTIHQNVAEQALTVSVRTVFDGRTARATTNKTDDDSLRRVVAASGALARSQPKNPGLAAHAWPAEIRQGRALFPRHRRAPRRSDRARAGRASDRARGRKIEQTAAGIFSTGASATALANSTRPLRRASPDARRIFRHHSGTGLLGLGQGQRARPAQIDTDALAERASQKAAASRNPREVEPGRWTVILEPAAVLDLVGFLFYDFAGTAILDQRSCFNKRMGKQVMGENITLHDDVTIRCNPGRRSTAKACRGRKFCWWIAACRAIWSMPAPRRKK